MQCLATFHWKIMKKENKFVYLRVLQSDYGYGHGWEDLCASESRAEIVANLGEYRENEGGTYRIITRRVLRKSFFS